LIRLIAPILPFTAEEAWEFLPASESGSIHLQTFTDVADVPVDDAAWEAFFALREQASTALDQAKKEKVVGSSIAAAVSVSGLATLDVDAFGEAWEQLFIVAKVIDGEALQVTAAEGVKCPRCWNVGAPAEPQHETHGQLCGRCFEVVTA